MTSFQPSPRLALPRPMVMLSDGKRRRTGHSFISSSRSLLLDSGSHRPPGHQSAWEILQQPLVKCPVVSHTPSGRSPNKTAKEAGYHDTRITYKDWSEVFPPAFERIYRSLEYASVWLPRRTQERRVIRSEGDVADFTLTNVVLPVTDILNSLIHRELQQDLIIVPAHECGMSIKVPDKDDPQKLAERSISLDHTLVLISRRAYEQNWTTKSEVYLVVIEEKRLPFVDPSHWTDNAFKAENTNSMQQHLPQLLMYAEHFKSSQLLLTDSLRYVAVNTSFLPSLPNREEKHAVVAYHRDARLTPPNRDDRHPFDPFFSGQRHSLCALGIEALRSHGILDEKVLSLSPELNPVQPRQYSREVHDILQAGQEKHALTHTTYEILDQIPCGTNQSLIAAYFEPDRIEVRRQRRAKETVPHPLPPRWSHL